MRRGQVALEFLTTYAWAIVSLIVVVGILAYFGVLSPSTYLPERCGFGAQMSCTDFAIERVSETQTQISLKLQNNYKRDISIVDVEAVEQGYSITGCSMPVDVQEGEELTMRCLIDGDWPAGQKTPIPLVMTFEDDEVAGAPQHQVTGEVYATIPREIQTTPLIECNDGINNDPGTNSCFDYPDDSGCASLDDDSESGGDCNTGDPNAPLSCFTTSNCQFTTIFKVSHYVDAHAEILSQSNFNRNVCCRTNTEATLSGDCSGSYETVLKLSNYTDAHVAEHPNALYGYSACLGATGATISCRYSGSDCNADETCVVQITDTVDAHIGDCTTAFPTRVCCQLT